MVALRLASFVGQLRSARAKQLPSAATRLCCLQVLDDTLKSKKDRGKEINEITIQVSNLNLNKMPDIDFNEFIQMMTVRENTSEDQEIEQAWQLLHYRSEFMVRTQCACG